MDKGAHFHRCDFQVHTPRDAAWKGARATTDAERKAYAQELIQACRTKGLDAIAITDHHDFTFFPYIRAAAQAEVDTVGNPVPKDKQVVIFPGLELTISSPPSQALLILDADFDEAKLNDILTTLKIEKVDEKDSSLSSVDSVSPQSVTSLNNLEDQLNQHKWLKGRFIILPNVTDGGHKTLYRDGFDKHYKEMPCVGGYVDGNYSKTSDGWKNILEGRQQNNGYKPVAVFQTSDNRQRDHGELGKHITWVKWSEPTAEALRQACLAKESRLSHIEPALPNIWITSLNVSNSKFLGSLDLDLNQQYSAIIGGRGTGKSTFLEYLRWGLCDQPVESADTDIVQGKRKNLIDNTLQKFDGEVHVSFLLNDVPHIVKRNSKTQEILLKIGDGDFEQVTEEEVRNLLPVQAYSQKQLSSVGVRINELKRFVELPIKQVLDGIRSEIRDAESKMRSAYNDFVRQRELGKEISGIEVEIASLEKQLKGLRDGLKGLSKEDQKIIDDKTRYDNEEGILDNLKNELEAAEGHVSALSEAFTEDSDEEVDEEAEEIELQNKALITSIEKQYATRFEDIRKKVDALSEIFEEASLKALNDKLAEWDKLKTKFEKDYEAAKSKAKINQQQLDQIRKVENRIKELKRTLADKKKANKELGSPEKVYKEWREKWNTAHRKKIDALDKQCEQFTSLSTGFIKAEIKNCLDTEALIARLKTAFAGMNIKEDKMSKICQYLTAATDTFAAWNEVLAELETLSLHDPESPDAIPDTPILAKSDFIQSERKRIAESLNPEGWLNLSVAELELNPRFHYCTNQKKAEYIAFADASAGQQATALLTVLLNQNGAPLIIDQPEDDVDSKLVKDVVERIWQAKSRRQLVFASHNANFVVNGDAELVVCCDYKKAGDQTKGHFKNVGAIDNKDVKEEITLVTEGGEQAFKLRKSKYGF